MILPVKMPCVVRGEGGGVGMLKLPIGLPEDKPVTHFGRKLATNTAFISPSTQSLNLNNSAAII